MAIAIARKTTGGMYINGKTKYSAGLDILCSTFVYMIILAFIVQQLINIISGNIENVSEHLIDGYEEFFG